MGEIHTRAKVSHASAGASSRCNLFGSGHFSGMRLLSSGLAAAAFMSQLLLPLTARAEPAKDKPAASVSVPKPETQDSKPILLAQAGPVGAPDIAIGGPSLAAGLAPLANAGVAATVLAQAVSVAQDPELAALPRVSLQDKVGADGKVESGLLTLDRETELNGYRGDTSTVVETRRNGWWATVAFVDTEETKLEVTAFIGLKDVDGKLTRFNDVGIAVNGEMKATIKMDELARLYKKAMVEKAVREGRVSAKDGKPLLLDSERELRFVKLIVEVASNDQLGEHIGFYVVPVDRPNGKVRGNIPVLVGAYLIESRRILSEIQFAESR